MPSLRLFRHERFVREYIRNGGNATKAYWKFNPGCKYASARTCGTRLLRSNPAVKRRYEELIERHMKRSDITVEKILSDYQWVINEGKETGKLSDVKSAAEAQAKLVGLLKDRIEAGGPGSFDQIDNIADVLEKVAQEAGAEAAQRLGEALGHLSAPNVPAAPERPSNEEIDGLLEAKTASDAVN